MRKKDCFKSKLAPIFQISNCFIVALICIFIFGNNISWAEVPPSGNNPPIANAGNDIVVTKNAPLSGTVLLDGSASSDPDGDDLYFTWYGPFATASSVIQTVDVPEGNYTISLIADDGQAVSDIDTANVTVTSCFGFDGYHSNADYNTIRWYSVSGTERYDIYRSSAENSVNFVKIGELSPTSSDEEEYTDNSVAGLGPLLYVVGSLQQGEWCFSDILYPKLSPEGLDIYSTPISNATVGIPYNYHVQSAGNPDFLNVNYSLISSPPGMQIDATGGIITWTPSETGMFEVTVEASYSFLFFSGTDSQSFTIEVDDPLGSDNHIPIAAAGPDQAIYRGDTVVLDGSGSSDLDSDPLTYQWTFVSRPAGSNAALSDSTTFNPTFIADVAGSYEVQLIVNDGTDNSTADTVTITATIRMVTVPDVTGLSHSQAESQIIASGLTNGVVANEYSSTVPASMVISQNPVAGGSVVESTAVDLVVSLGPPAVPTVTFEPVAITIAQGESATLTWNTVNATNVFIDNGIGTVALSGSVSVSPATTTTYTITATGTGGTTTGTATVTVVPPPTVIMSASPATIGLGSSTQLSWTSTDAQSAQIDMGIGIVPVNGSITVSPATTTTYTITITGIDGSTITNSVTVTVVPAPTVNISANPGTIIAGEASTLTWSTTDASTVTIDNGIGSVPLNGSISVSPASTTTYNITATGLGGTATASVGVTVQPASSPPTVNLSPTTITIAQGDSTTLAWNTVGATNVFIDNGVGAVAASGSIMVTPAHTTTYTLTASGSGGSAAAQSVVHVTAVPTAQPEGSFGQHYEHLIPPDATIEEYDHYRFSVITGLIHDVNDSPIEDVMVTISNHPEYGSVHTDIDGRFSIPVEGGGHLTIACQKAGYINVQRKVFVPWNDIASIDTFQMLEQDTASTQIQFDGDPQTAMTHRSSITTDNDGNRAVTMVFSGDTNAYLVDENGNDAHALSTIVTRATEYATPETMPAELPPNSAFTYCAELTVDGVDRVRFDKPVVTWVENFIGFDVGTPAPVGYYDKDKGQWVPSDNGVVVRLLDTDSDGIVDALDADDNGQPNDLDADGQFSDEVQGLNDPAAYPPDSTFIRVAFTHFSPWDINWPFGPPSDSISPNGPGRPDADQRSPKVDSCIIQTGSFAEVRSRVHHEDIPIAGTDMTLHYTSSRTQGYGHVINVAASDDTVPASLIEIVVQLKVAGRTLQQVLPALPNQTIQIVWDGLDYMGQAVSKSVDATVRVGFVYDALYYWPGNFGRSFGQNGSSPTGISSRRAVTIWEDTDLILRKGVGTISEGWTLSSHHQFQKDAKILHKGDGSVLKDSNNLINSMAGNGQYGYSGDDVPAVQAMLHSPHGMTFDAAGNLYIADTYNNRIRKVDTSGIITTVAGNGQLGFSGDGVPAVQAELYYPTDLAIDGAGNLYIADTYNHRIRMVDINGIITTMAGGAYGGDGVPANQARLNRPFSVTFDAAGNLYIADTDNHRIRKVDTSGIITTIAGTGSAGYSGDDGPAVQAELNFPNDLAIDGAGNLYFSDASENIVRKVDTSGIITTIAGTGSAGYSGDDGPAAQAMLSSPRGVSVDSYGNLYIADIHNHRIRKVDINGIITTMAGNGLVGSPSTSSGDGGPANQARLNFPQGVTVDTAGNLYVADTNSNKVRQVAKTAGVFYNTMINGQLVVVAAEKSGLGTVISENGLHINTIDLETGVTLYTFGYDNNEYLISVTDRFGNQTTIQRNAYGVPASITSPDGQVTGLTIDAANQLVSIDYEDNSAYSFEYPGNGLLTAKVDPNLNRFEHHFDARGRLTNATDQEGGDWHYTRTMLPNGDIQTDVITAEGNLTTYIDSTDSTGRYASTITDPTGAQAEFSLSSDGLTVNKNLACGMDLAITYDVDSEYKFKVMRQMTETTPGGLSRATQRDKTYQDTDADQINDLMTETITVNNKTMTLTQNTLLSQIDTTSPEGRTITSTYDPSNLLTLNMIVPGLSQTDYGYDDRGRLTSITTGSRQVSYTYDSNGFVDSITDPELNSTYFTNDALGRITGISRPDGSTLGISYDANGNMTVLTNPATVDHGLSYNGVNLSDGYQTPISGSYSYLYDADRRLITTTFPSGNRINNIYTTTRLTQIQTPEGDIDLTYSCGSKIESLTKAGETIGYSYDGKLLTDVSLSGTLNQNLNYTYNNDFDVTGLTYAGATTAFSYDLDGLLTGVGSYTITRNTQNGLPETVSGGALSINRTFSGYGELDSQNVIIGGSAAVEWTLTRDNAGRITQKTETADGITATYDYTYDPMGRLETVTKDGTLVESYGYDSDGTRLTETNALRGITDRSFGYSDEDHLLSAGSVIYSYDLDGFLGTKTDGSQVTTYDYSLRGELMQVDLPDGAIIGYVSDPIGRRIAKSVNGNVVERYLWQGFTRLLAVYDGSNNLIQRFEYADGRMPVSMTMAGATYYLAYDQVGSLRVVTDSSGNVVKRIDYDSFGNIITDTNTSITIPFGFAGGLHDRDTGLVRFGFRDYDPDLGRWTAKDPIGFAAGDTDLYGYVQYNPVNFCDPLGLINPVKTVVGFANALNGVKLMTTGVATLTTGTAAIPFTDGISGAVAYPIGLAQLAFGFANINRGVRQMSEAYDESLCQASFKNLLGLLPFGHKYDDALEPGFFGYFGGVWNNFVADPVGAFWQTLKDFFAFD